MSIRKLALPPLPYGYEALEPIMSKEVLTLHRDKHHQAYVDGANKIIDKLEQARAEEQTIDLKAALKELSFHFGGHKLHSIFWQIMRAPQDNNQPPAEFLKIIEDNFKSLTRFQAEFEQVAISVEGSGWAALMACPKQGCLELAQIEKHNLNHYVGFQPILVLDVWEHAYYLDYKNNRAQFVKNFWQIVNWDEVAKRYKTLTEGKECEC